MTLDYQGVLVLTFTFSLILSLVLIGFCLLGRSMKSRASDGQFVTGNVFLFFAGLSLVYCYVFSWVIPHWGYISQFAMDIESVFR